MVIYLNTIILIGSFFKASNVCRYITSFGKPCKGSRFKAVVYKTTCSNSKSWSVPSVVEIPKFFIASMPLFVFNFCVVVLNPKFFCTVACSCHSVLSCTSSLVLPLVVQQHLTTSQFTRANIRLCHVKSYRQEVTGSNNF